MEDVNLVINAIDRKIEVNKRIIESNKNTKGQVDIVHNKCALRALKTVMELERIRFDLIHDTHRNEIYNLYNKLSVAMADFEQTRGLDKEICANRVERLKAQIYSLEEKDKETLSNEKGMKM